MCESRTKCVKENTQIAGFGTMDRRELKKVTVTVTVTGTVKIIVLVCKGKGVGRTYGKSDKEDK